MDQLDSGVLDDDTTLVTLTAGGNDQDAFSNAFTECAGLVSDCSGPGFLAKYEGVIDGDIVPDTGRTIHMINERAPNARILLVSYPVIVSTQTVCPGSPTTGLNESRDLATLAEYLNDAESDMVGGLSLEHPTGGIAIVSPLAAFAGHAACDSDPWINAVVVGPNGDGDFHKGDPESRLCAPAWVPAIGPCLSRESFHPTREGSTTYEHVVEQWLTSIGYTGG
ncbi:hypothetical protein [Actinacidiphila sp. ITFR-21]|uniref:hypothetical protein n=1 Tax=Actinacidiphila sp. ITFR-21 TaxID=3075199 RepID=UPI00288BA2D8|nr:hypothetical protein [Streptomyces sp. ITFR-21]WNI16184.1 hypothetical protein RLT57_12005 [Streptomyces sp. ITFR-21]